MKLKNHLTICLFLLCNAILFAQQGLQKKADNLFNKFSFVSASLVYKDIIDKGYNVNYATRQLADCYAYMRNPEMAAFYYKTVVEQDNAPVEYLYKYAQSLRGIKDYKSSREWMRKYKEAGGTLSIKGLSKDSDFINSIYNATQNYELNEVKFNSSLSDFGAIEYNDKIYFSSTANPGVTTKHLYGWNEQPFLDIYAVNKDADTIIHHQSKIKGAINSTYHDGPLTISNDGKTMFFSRNNSDKNGLTKDKKGYSNLKIYKATLINNEWSNIEELPFNNDEYSVGHPSLNKDNSKLYFASDMPGGIGGSDIYYVDIHKNGTYSTPTNLGEVVNTAKNELFPFINDENVLFLSSDGHLGLGLLDIFSTIKDKNGIITDVLNLGIPVNSNKDDFSFFMNEDGLSGYIASNRDGGKGDDDIYSFNRTPQLVVEGSVIDPELNTPITNAIVTLLNKNDEIIAFAKTDENGRYEINIDRNTDYTINTKKDNYEDNIINISSKGLDKKVSNLTADISLTPIPKKIEEITELYPIYFDYNKHEIREESTKELDRIVSLMTNTYPDMVIKIESYSDSRGLASYNKKLSQERAKSTYNYLINNGISSSRITDYTGYGEENLVNHCNGKVRCTEKEHQLNRRTLFIVIKMN